MPKSFDDDVAGSILEFGKLMRGNGVVSSPAQKAWEKANLKSAHPQTWIGPAMFYTHLVTLLSPGRDRDAVKARLGRAFRVLEREHLIEPWSKDDNPNTSYRVLSELGEELLGEDSYKEYLFGSAYIVGAWRSSVVKIFHPSDAGIGTGFVVADGLIATARHVIEELDEYAVQLDDGRIVATRGVRVPRAEHLDIALVEADLPEDVRPFRLARSYDLLDDVVIFGFPPVAHSDDAYLVVNKGEVSSVVTLRTGFQAIVVSTILRGGNSGGPVVNRRGQVVGVVSDNLFNDLKPQERSVNEGLAFAAATPVELLGDLLSGKV